MTDTDLLIRNLRRENEALRAELDKNAVFFTGDGIQNWFRSVY